MNAPTVPFPRPLSVGVPQGQDIIALKRAISRAGFWPWTTFTPYYTKAFSKSVAWFQRGEKLVADGVYGPVTHEHLRKTHRVAHPDEWAFDAVAIHLMNEAYLLQHPGIVAPCKTGVRPRYLHETGGLNGNWALDWMNPTGTAIYAPLACTITQLSGSDPSHGVHKGDRFGWSMHFTDDRGRTYFATHMGSRSVSDGQKVTVAQKLGTIGSWPHDPGRSHLHLGVDAGTDAASQKWILEIAAAPRP